MAVRILAASKYNAHTGPLFKQLNLLKVSDMYKIQEIKSAEARRMCSPS